MRLRVSDLEMALRAIAIQNRAVVRKWAVGRDPVGRRPSALRAERSFRGGCAVSTDDNVRLTPFDVVVNDENRTKIGRRKSDTTSRLCYNVFRGEHTTQPMGTGQGQSDVLCGCAERGGSASYPLALSIIRTLVAGVLHFRVRLPAPFA